MKEQKSKWDSEYINSSNHLLELDSKSPENFIDNIKMEYLQHYLPKDGIILEVGAGSGRLITRIGLENRNLRLIGVDYSKPSSMIINKNFIYFDLNGTSICADVFHLPFKTMTIESVISGGFLEHFNKTEIDDIIREIVRVLKPHGLFYADIAPKKKSLLRPIILKDIGGYENSFTIKDWYRIFKDNGLSYITIFSGLIVPPNFYLWFRCGLKLDTIYRLKNFIKNLDDTWWSDILGFEYFVFGRKI